MTTQDTENQYGSYMGDAPKVLIWDPQNKTLSCRVLEERPLLPGQQPLTAKPSPNWQAIAEELAGALVDISVGATQAYNGQPQQFCEAAYTLATKALTRFNEAKGA